jgi:aminobenzoyl-glutamate utilization protein A
MTEDLSQKVTAWRRDFHKHPELGFREFRTASKAAQVLEELGFTLHLGAKAMDPTVILDYPASLIAAAHDAAISNGGDPKLLPMMEGGLTAVIAELDTGRPGPTVAFRFDMDALPIQEECHGPHRPAAEGFASVTDGLMHACGHDGHAAIGLGLASQLAAHQDELKGRIRLIIQPAEEGAPGGAASIVARGWGDDIDYFIGCHLGLGVPTGKVVARAHLLATTKYRVTLRGRGAHVTYAPHDGRNALLAAATATLAMHSIPPHSHGWFSLNVGVLRAGDEQGVTPSHATMEVGVWSDTVEVHEYVKGRITDILEGVCASAGVELEIRHIGESPTSPQHEELGAIALEAASLVPGVVELEDEVQCRAADDAEVLLYRVTERGGKGIYLLIGSELVDGHHTPTFDFDESSLEMGTELLTNIALLISRRPWTE